MDFEPYFKVHNLVSVHPKSLILGQMTNLKMVVHIVVSVYRLVKILKLAPVPWWISERLISGIVTDDYKVQGMNKLPFEISPNFLYVNLVFGRRRRSISLNQPLSLCRWANTWSQVNVSVKSKLQHPPPGQPPGICIFCKIFVQIPPSRGRKAVQMPHHRSIPGDQMPPPPGNFSAAFIMLRKLCM